MNTFIGILLIAGSVIIVYELIQITRVEILNNKVTILYHAIYNYCHDMFAAGKVPEVRFDDIKVPDSVLHDIRAWNYTSLISPDKFEKIKKYIKK